MYQLKIDHLLRRSSMYIVASSVPSIAGCYWPSEMAEIFSKRLKELNAMKKSILCLTALLLATSACADDRRFYTTRDGAGYEAGLRKAGIPQSAGMVWPVANPAAATAVAAPPVAQVPRPRSAVKSAGSVATRQQNDA